MKIKGKFYSIVNGFLFIQGVYSDNDIVTIELSPQELAEQLTPEELTEIVGSVVNRIKPKDRCNICGKYSGNNILKLCDECLMKQSNPKKLC